MAPGIDQEYYEVASPGSFAEALMKKARAQIYDDFMRFAAPNARNTILDVGVSDVHTDGANWTEVQYPFKENVSACGLGEALQFRAAFPQIAYTQIEPNQRLPYADNEFDIATSNAVLEHVGSTDNQTLFVKELIRVARTVFITVPHRFFPIEHHTGIPILHYSDWTFRIACKAFGKSKWTLAENLILMSKARLLSLAPKERAHVGHTGLRLGPFSSNLFLGYRK